MEVELHTQGDWEAPGCSLLTPKGDTTHIIVVMGVPEQDRTGWGPGRE